MRYSDLVKERAKGLYKSGVVTYREYMGSRWWFRRKHVCWPQCVDERNNLWRCEECGKWDKERGK